MHILKIRIARFLPYVFLATFLFVMFYALPVHADIIRSITFPVDGPSSFTNTFIPVGGSPHQHLAIDIIAKKMAPLVSAVDGYVSYVVSPEASWGYSISITDDDGYTYNYLHMNNDTPGTDDGIGGELYAYAPGIKREVRVLKGQLVGWVGDSGNAENTISHVHFEIADPSHNRFNPYESLINATGQYVPSTPVAAFPTGTVSHPIDPTIISPSTVLPAGCVSVSGFSPVTGQSCSTNIVTPLPANQNLALGITSDAVRQLQLQLQTLGYFNSLATGYFGPITRAAVVAFQIAKGINPTGVIGTQTQLALNQVPSGNNQVAVVNGSSPYVFAQNVSEGSSGEVVRQLQLKLQTLGYFANTVTGYFGPVTRAAVVAFQIAKGINPIGLVGPKTQLALNSRVVGLPQTGTLPAPTIIAASGLPDGNVGVDYRTKIYVTDGFLPYTWQVISGALPLGLTFEGTTGTISGVPTTPVISDFVVKATDGNNMVVTKSFRIQIR